MERMRQLCQDNGVELILIKAPSVYPYWYEEYDAQIADFAEKNGLAYYDFTKVTEEIGLDFQTDTYDSGLHLNHTGAVKLSHYFARILVEKHGLKDHGHDPNVMYEYIEELKRYEEEIQK